MITKNDQSENPWYQRLHEEAARKLLAGENQPESIDPQEIRTLLQELEIRQVELEMQNAELRQAQSEVERSSSLFYNLFEFAPVGYMNVDMRGFITQCNLKASQMLGAPKSEILNRPLTRFLAESSQSYFLFAKERAQKFGENQIVELQLGRSPLRICNAELALIKQDDIEQIRLVMTDITSLKLTEKKLEGAMLQAEEANRLKSEFLANMSHELRTPLNAILGFAEILANELDGQETGQQAGYIRTAGDTLLALVNNVLELSKIEAGKLEVNIAAVKAENLLAEVTDLMIGQAHKKGVSLKVEADPLVPQVFLGDELKLKEVLLNLIGNAIKFTDEGVIRLHLECRKTPDPKQPERLLFTVDDTGRGIDSQTSEELFEAFNQGQLTARGKAAGTGLGLTICKRLVEAMGGEIGVIGKPEGGTQFWFDVPWGETEFLPEADLLSAQLCISMIEDLKQRKLKVLIVDDEVLNRSLLKAMLKAIDAKTTEAEDGTPVLNMVREDQPDLLLLDLLMPNVDGFEVARRVRNDPMIHNTPIIAVSAFNPDMVTSKSDFSTFDQFVMKPLDQKVLVQAIHKTLVGD